MSNAYFPYESKIDYQINSINNTSKSQINNSYQNSQINLNNNDIYNQFHYLQQKNNFNNNTQTQKSEIEIEIKYLKKLYIIINFVIFIV